MKGKAEKNKEKETHIKKKNPKLKELKRYNFRKKIPVTKSKPNGRKEQKKLLTNVSKNNKKKFKTSVAKKINMKDKTKWKKIVVRKRNLQVDKTKVTKEASGKRKYPSCSVDMDDKDKNLNLKLEEEDVLNRNACKNGLQENNIVNSKNDNYSSDTSDNELPEAFTPQKPSAQGCFAVGDVVWAKYRTSPYWPGQVTKISIAKNKNKKIYVKFFYDSCKQSLSTPAKNMLRFACEQSRREELLNEGKRMPEHQQQMFQKAVDLAEDLIRQKALGKKLEYTDEEYDNFDPKQEKEEENGKESSDESDRDIPEAQNHAHLSSRKRRRSSKYSNILKYIKQSKPHLKLIYEGKTRSGRHLIYKNGTVKEKNNLKLKSGFGPLKESECEKVLNFLQAYYKEMDNTAEFSEVSYVFDVWLPEAMIFAIQQIENLDWEKAEEKYMEESDMNKHEERQSVHPLLKKLKVVSPKRRGKKPCRD